MRLFIYLFSLLFMIICCDPPLTPEELAELADANDPRARITMDMTEELELTISIKNFDDQIAIITFNLIYDNTVLKVISYSGGELGAPLFANIDEMDVDKKELWWYLETRKFGTCVHSGFGLGFERLIMFVTGMKNIRDVIPFPRTPQNAEF